MKMESKRDSMKMNKLLDKAIKEYIALIKQGVKMKIKIYNSLKRYYKKKVNPTVKEKQFIRKTFFEWLKNKE